MKLQGEMRKCKKASPLSRKKCHGGFEWLLSFMATLQATEHNLAVTVLTDGFSTVSGLVCFLTTFFFSTLSFVSMASTAVCLLLSFCVSLSFVIHLLSVSLCVPILLSKRESWMGESLQHQHPYWTESLHHTAWWAAGQPIKWPHMTCSNHLS